MNSKSDPQEILKIQQAIRQTEDNLVQWIEYAVDNRDSGDLIKNSQFRNLVRVAATTESTEVIKNFLRYQMGRDKKWGQGANALANQIITDVGSTKDIDSAEDTGKLFKTAHDIASLLFSQGDDFSYKRNNIWLTIIRLYLGYGSRYLVYRQKNGGDNNHRKRESSVRDSGIKSNESKQLIEKAGSKPIKKVR